MLMHGFLFSEEKKKMKKMLKYEHSLTAQMLTLGWYLTPKESRNPTEAIGHLYG